MVYILQNPAGKFYIGHTDDLCLRLHSHNRTDRVLGKFTRKNGPWELVWTEEHPTRAAAMARERQIKARVCYLWLPSMAISLRRVRQRVKKGDHDVAQVDRVDRRWQVSRRFRCPRQNVQSLRQAEWSMIVAYPVSSPDAEP